MRTQVSVCAHAHTHTHTWNSREPWTRSRRYWALFPALLLNLRFSSVKGMLGPARFLRFLTSSLSGSAWQCRLPPPPSPLPALGFSRALHVSPRISLIAFRPEQQAQAGRGRGSMHFVSVWGQSSFYGYFSSAINAKSPVKHPARDRRTWLVLLQVDSFPFHFLFLVYLGAHTHLRPGSFHQPHPLEKPHFFLISGSPRHVSRGSRMN